MSSIHLLPDHLISQIADRHYVERCYFHLYPEFVLGGVDRLRSADGKETILYADAGDLLRRTPAFYQHIVSKRLDIDFGRVYRFLGHHFAGANPYAESVEHNLRHLSAVLGPDGLRHLRSEPLSTTVNLAPIYHLPHPFPDLAAS